VDQYGHGSGCHGYVRYLASGRGVPSSALLSRFAVNKEKALSLISGRTISELPTLSFSLATVRRETRWFRANADREKLFFKAGTLLFWRKFISIRAMSRQKWRALIRERKYCKTRHGRLGRASNKEEKRAWNDIIKASCECDSFVFDAKGS